MPWPLRMISYATVLLIIIFIYFTIRYIKSVNKIQPKNRWLWNAVPPALAILFLAYPLWGWFTYRSSGTFGQSGFPVAFIYTFWHGLVFMGVMLNWLVLHDAA